MKKADTKVQATSFGDLVTASEPRTDVVELEGMNVVVRELSGRERFEASEIAERENSWEVVLWMCFTGIVAPRPDSIDDLEKLRPEWCKEIGKAIMGLSGMTMEEDDNAEKELADVTDIGGS